MTEGRARRPDLRELRVRLGVRARTGARRVRRALLPVLSAALAAVVAYWFSGEVLGNSYPVFAAISAWITLGFSTTRQLRRVAELGAGVTVGVWLGELFLHLFGTGALQVGVILVLAALIARFLDRGQLLTTQAGTNGIVIVGLPWLSGADGGFGRWTDALVGVTLALLVAAVTPGDVRTRPRELVRAGLGETAAVLDASATALRTGQRSTAQDALVRGRSTQSIFDDGYAAVASARELVRVNPALRRYAGEVAELGRAAELADRAMRNARVVARRTRAAAEQGPVPELADTVGELARALHALAATFAQQRPPAEARAALLEAAERLNPRAFAEQGWQAMTVVPLLRSLAVDALQITGLSQSEASALLPP